MLAIDLYRIIGEYLADPHLRIESFSAMSESVNLSVSDADSVRYVRSLAVPGGFRYVGTTAHEGERQSVTVAIDRADHVFVSVTLTITDPATVTRLRAVEETGAARAAAILTALPSHANQQAAIVAGEV